MNDNTSPWEAWKKWLHYWLYERWHGGKSVGLFDVTETESFAEPGLNLGFVRVTWAFLVKVLLALVALVAVAGLVFLLTQIDWYQVGPQLFKWPLIWVPAVLVFAFGFVIGYIFKSATSGGGKNGLS